VKRDSRKANQAASAYLNTLSPDKRRPVARLLELYVGESSTLDEFDWSSISHASLVDARSRLARKYSPSTVNSALSCVRSVLRYGLRLGIIPTHNYLDSLEVAGVDRRRPTVSLELTPARLSLLFRACANDRQATGRRDAFVLLMVAGAGFDRREIVAFSHLRRPRPFEGSLFVSEVNHQKGRCSLALERRGRDIVDAWLDARGTAPGPTVCAVAGDGTVLTNESVHEQLTYRVIQKRAREAGLTHISTTALKWYYRLHLPGEMRRANFLIPTDVRRVLEPPE
jgi:integrase/recombinase XerD